MGKLGSKITRNVRRTCGKKKSFKKKGTHYLKVVNLGTPGRARFEVDAVVVGR